MLTTLVKKSIYSVYSSKSLQAFDLNLGYIFHTEWLYHTATFDQLLAFCKNYTSLTRAKVICTIMTGVNPLVQAGMKKENCSAELFLERVNKLAQVATIGYHGHFWTNTHRFTEAAFAIHSNTFEPKLLQPQLEADLNWFQQNKIEHNGIYAAGWWFTNRYLLEQLLQANFTVDYSFSKAPYFYNAFSMKLMQENNIKTGEAFFVRPKESSKRMLCIQNLIGAHDSPFVLDFDRNLKKILDSKNVYGVLNAHDYDRSFTYTLNCIEHLLKDANAKFFGHTELVEFASMAHVKEILI